MKKIEFNVDLKTGNTTVEAPWGDADITCPLDTIRNTLAQLKYFRREGNESHHLKMDIKGYRMIIQEGLPVNAETFLGIKDDGRSGKGPSFANNVEVVTYMKKNQLWRTRQ